MKKCSLLFFLALYFLKSLSQNVGIGTPAPLTKLHVEGAAANIATFNGGTGMWITLAENGANRGYIGSFIGSPEDVDFGTYSGNTTGKIHLATNGTARITVSSSGNIGIGQTSPNFPLNFSSTLGNKISLYGNGTNNYGMGIQNLLMQFYTDVAGADIAFGYGNSNAFTETMRIKGTGNVGIGTSSPNSSAALDISSTSKGMLAPRLTKSQREAIASPVAGLLVFDLTYKMFFYYDGVSWVPLKPSSLEEIGQGPQVPADNTTGSDFGYAVSTDSVWSISGAPSQNGNVGAAYIYQYAGGQWNEFAKIIPDDLQIQNFGSSVSISFPYAVVGAPAYNSFAGCVYVFFYNGSSWVQVNKFFRPSSATLGDLFGYSVDIDGNNFVVGCPGADIAFTNDGCIFTYKYNGSAWVYNNAPTISAPVLNNFSNVGTAVAIAHNTIVAGAPGQVVGGSQSGVAFMYRLVSGVWNTGSPLPSAGGGGNGVKIRGYGKSVDLSYNPSANYPLSVIVGAPDTDFEYTVAPAIPDFGLVEVFLGDENGVSTLFSTWGLFPEDTKLRDAGGAIYRSYENAQDYKFGSSVSIYHYGNSLLYPGLNIQLAVGCPGKNNNTGAIEVYNMRNAVEAVTGQQTGFSFSPSFVRSYDYSAPSSLMGASVNMFNKTTMIAGAPGAGNNKGAVIFKF